MDKAQAWIDEKRAEGDLAKYYPSESRDSNFVGAPVGTCQVYIIGNVGRIYKGSEPLEATEHGGSMIPIEDYKKCTATDNVHVVWIVKA